MPGIGLGLEAATSSLAQHRFHISSAVGMLAVIVVTIVWGHRTTMLAVGLAYEILDIEVLPGSISRADEQLKGGHCLGLKPSVCRERNRTIVPSTWSNVCRDSQFSFRAKDIGQRFPAVLGCRKTRKPARTRLCG